MALRGRGTNYSRARGVSEWVLSRAFRGGWPAKLVRAARLQDRVRTHRHRVRSGAWPDGLRPLRIAFVSDIHAGPTTHASIIREAADAIAASQPDVLLLGGDYVLFDARHVDALGPILEIEAPLGRFAVLGNHDLWADDGHIVAAIERAGIRVLVNENVALPAPYDRVSVCGLDEPWTGRPDATATFDGARDVRVLLAHAPSAVALVDEPFDVCVCGHTHGGHIALPGGIPIIAVGPLAREHPHGRHVNKGRTLIVSRGIGGSESALRLFAPPDVQIVELGD